MSDPSRARLRLWFSLWPLAVLLSEYLWITLQFDALPLLQSAGAAHGFGHLGIVAPLFVVVATATYILSGRQLRAELANALLAPEGSARRSLGLAINVASFVGLYALTANLLARVEAERSIAWPWLLLWLALAVSTALAPLLTLVSWRALRGDSSSKVSDALVLGCVVGALGWAAGLASERLWSSLSVWTLQSVHLLMLPFSDNIIYEPEKLAIGTTDFVVLVAPECSGVEGMGLIVVVMAIYLWSARQRLRFPRALWLLPIAVLAVWIGNAARIALLIAVGVKISIDVALSGFHSKAGWLFFCGIALGMIALVQRSRFWLRDDAATEDRAETWNPAGTYLSPLLALIATSLLTALFSTGFDPLYGLRILAVAAALYLQRKHLPRATWPPSWHAPVIGVLVYGLWIVLCSRPVAADVTQLKTEIVSLGQPMSAVWLGLRALGSVITVPIAEELAFRGFLLRRLIDRDFTEVDKRRLTPLAVGISSLAFGVLHPGAIFAGCLAGLAYAFAQSIRGRTADAILAHAITNALIAVQVLCFDAYWLWT